MPNISNSPKNPLVSIITPSYNQGHFIRETIESVLSQDYNAIEYIVMDGGSSDDTTDILKEYGDRIIWYSEPDEGQADAVNKGIKISKGDIIGWLNSDDTYATDAVLKIVSEFFRHPDTAVIYGEGFHLSKTGAVIDRYPSEPFDMRSLAERCLICQPAAFIRRDKLIAVGLLRKELQLCMDYDLWIRMGKTNNLHYIPYHLANSRIYPENKTFSRTIEAFEEILEMVYTHYGYYPISWVYGYEKNRSDRKLTIILLLCVIYRFFYLNNINNPAFIKYMVNLFCPRVMDGKISLQLWNIVLHGFKGDLIH